MKLERGIGPESECKEPRLQPFLKWAGGKRWLVNRGIPRPSRITRLVEPFVGSAAVFFALAPSSALLADVNPDLINLYQMMRDAAPELQSIMIEYNRSHSVEKYYVERSMSYSDPVRRAARLLYLNRTCWNGLYRVNRRGEFNVPVGTKTCVIWDTEDFCSYAERLKRASIICQDFESTIDLCGPGDFLFVDPPYTVKHNMNGFIKYNEKLFSWDDQRRLASALRRAGSRGAAILVTNADHESVRDLYNKEFEYRPVSRHSVLAGSSRYRGKTTEALFLMNITDSIAVS